METTNRRNPDAKALIRRLVAKVLSVFTAVFAIVTPNVGFTPHAQMDRHGMEYFRREMWRTIRADHPAILPVAAAIREITADPLQQIVLVNDVTHLLVDYDDDTRIYGADDFHATLDEMIQRRRAGGWAYLRDDCDGRAVFAAHILSSLGIQWRFEASYWKEHAWVVAKVNGVEYDLLDLKKNARETDRIAFKLLGRHFVRASQPPPYFNWRQACETKTARNLNLGLTLGMLTLNSTPLAMHSRRATDWTRLAPNAVQPPPDNDAALATGLAGFPFGESLFVGAVAAVKPAAGTEEARGATTASN